MAPQTKETFLKRGGLWVIGQSALLFAVISLPFHYRGGNWNDGVSLLLGVVSLFFGAACGISGVIALGRNLTPFPEPARDSSFVQHGIYGLIRHPLYTAVFCGSLGWALVWRSLPALFVALALGPFFAAKARREERGLREKFPEYADYERRVRRFIPWVY